MKKQLEFIQGQGKPNDMVLGSGSIHVNDGRAQATDGHTILDTPCPPLEGLEFTTPLKGFMAAITAAGSNPAVTKDDSKLIVTGGSFKAALPLLDHELYPRDEWPDRKPVTVDGAALQAAIKVALPFALDGASSFTDGLLLDAGYIYATDRTCAVRVPVPGVNGSNTMLPYKAAAELLKHAAPVAMEVREAAVYFLYEDGSWMRSMLFAFEFPKAMMEKIITEQHAVPVPTLQEGFAEAVDTLMPFAGSGQFYFKDGKIAVSTPDYGGADVAGFEFETPSGFTVATIQAVLTIATHFDPSVYPKPAPFSGPGGVLGVANGVRT